LPREAKVDAPIMPGADDPDADAWEAAVADHMAAINEDFVAVGHSLGGSTILKTIAQDGAPTTLRGVVTIAMPFWPDWGISSYAVSEDTGRLQGVPLILYFSSDDETVAIDHLARYGEILPHATLRQVSGTGHLFDNAPFAQIAGDIVALFGDGR
jgi:uncharacterized protein